MDERTQLDQLRSQIRTCPEHTRIDLNRILKTCETIYTDLNRESVECRRLRKITAKYSTLETQLNKQIQFLSKRITWATFL